MNVFYAPPQDSPEELTLSLAPDELRALLDDGTLQVQIEIPDRGATVVRLHSAQEVAR